MNKLNFKGYYKRNLPHIQIEGCIYAISFRLAFSLPKPILDKLKNDKKLYEENCKKLEGEQLKLYKDENSKKYYEDFDSFLGKYKNSANWLLTNEVAKVVAESLHFWHNKRYDLYCYCIMPNHVHLIIKPYRKNEDYYYSLSEILFSIKRYTVKKCNKILKREGQFWQHEYYDHVIRDIKDFNYQILYTLENPVKANLISKWDEWEYSFLNKDLCSATC